MVSEKLFLWIAALLLSFALAADAFWPHWPSQTTGAINQQTGQSTISGNDWNAASTRVYHLTALSFRPTNGSACSTPVYDRAAGELPSAGGTVHPYLTCTDSPADEVAVVIPLIEESITAGWEGNIQITAIASYVDVDATPAANPPTGTVMGFNVSSDCVKLPASEDDTYGTPQTLTVPLTVNEAFAVGTTPLIASSGTCTGPAQATPVLLKIRLAVNTGIFNCPTGCSVTEMRLNYVIVKLLGS